MTLQYADILSHSYYYTLQTLTIGSKFLEIFVHGTQILVTHVFKNLYQGLHCLTLTHHILQRVFLHAQHLLYLVIVGPQTGNQLTEGSRCYFRHQHQRVAGRSKT